MFKIMFAFQGRIGRLNYLLGAMTQGLLVGLLMILMMLSLGGMAVVMAPLSEAGGVADPDVMQALATGVGLTGIVMFLILICFAIYMSTALQMKRLHDLNLSGWFLLVQFAPFLSFLLLGVLGPLAFVLWLLPLGLGLLCVFGPGTKGPNKYGELPLSIFDIADSDDGDWHDRVESYKNVLKEQQLEKREIKEAEVAPRPRRRPAPASGGFGRRGKV